MNAANLIPGDRTGPRLPLQPYLRAVADKISQPRPQRVCPVYSRVDGQFPVADGFLYPAEALALLVAGEA